MPSKTYIVLVGGIAQEGVHHTLEEARRFVENKTKQLVREINSEHTFAIRIVEVVERTDVVTHQHKPTEDIELKGLNRLLSE